jgi:hypothetical protein
MNAQNFVTNFVMEVHQINGLGLRFSRFKAVFYSPNKSFIYGFENILLYIIWLCLFLQINLRTVVWVVKLKTVDSALKSADNIFLES